MFIQSGQFQRNKMKLIFNYLYLIHGAHTSPFVAYFANIAECEQREQEPMSRSMQLHYISVTAFSWTDLFLDRVPLEQDSRGSAMANHKELIDVTASLERNCLYYRKENVYLK